MYVREAVFLAITGDKFVEESLLEWQTRDKPSQRDFNLAFEMGNGTMRLKGILEKIAKAHVAVLPRKKKEKMLLYMMLYQIYFLDRIPMHAIVMEGVEIAKRHVSQPFAKFINATFRNFEKKDVIYTDSDAYPEYFVARMKDKTVLKCMNRVFPLQARVRKTNEIVEVQDLKEAVKDTSLYIQNGSFVKLVLELKKHLKTEPQNVLDMAGAPGGKLILVHDLFPKAELFANDVQVKKLEENLAKYQIEADVREGKAEEYPAGKKFDLIVCDLPCSNTGVLGKRPEARWRLTEENVAALEKMQIAILKHAKTLLAPNGQIWYMTCSILKEENENVVQKSGLKKVFDTTHLPDEKGFDGGYGAVLV